MNNFLGGKLKVQVFFGVCLTGLVFFGGGQ